MLSVSLTQKASLFQYCTSDGGLFCTSLGGHAYSPNGSHWYISPVPVYAPVVRFGDGSELFFRARERPHVSRAIFAAASQPACHVPNHCIQTDWSFCHSITSLR